MQEAPWISGVESWKDKGLNLKPARRWQQCKICLMIHCWKTCQRDNHPLIWQQPNNPNHSSEKSRRENECECPPAKGPHRHGRMECNAALPTGSGSAKTGYHQLPPNKRKRTLLTLPGTEMHKKMKSSHCTDTIQEGFPDCCDCIRTDKLRVNELKPRCYRKPIEMPLSIVTFRLWPRPQSPKLFSPKPDLLFNMFVEKNEQHEISDFSLHSRDKTLSRFWSLAYLKRSGLLILRL